MTQETELPALPGAAHGFYAVPMFTADQMRAYATTAVLAERERQSAELLRLRTALGMYADPSFYHGCAFLFDRPTGGFDEDFDYDEEYERDMPGKLARETLSTPPAVKEGRWTT